ncbi:hypothetical protein SEUCBS140593_004445 [Sporothrix eucalyptigena]|uniref:Uncharacterized protein n=1 Tax=Sporothrix eucalyptigena TaxID=1812306 RepID=A0ABP0BN42_9PEZI
MVSPHAHLPLISALTTFYRLLVDLRHVPEAKLLEPSWPDEREDGWKRHPPHSINAAAARLHGFSDAAIDLAYRVPYVTEDYTYVFMETEAISYLRSSVATALESRESSHDEDEKMDLDNLTEEEDPFGEGMDGWDYARDPTYQERTDLWDGRDVLLLTIGHVYGTELVYDLERQTITEWYHFRVEHDDFDAVPAYPMTSPDNPLYVWIRKLLTLRNVALESHILPPPDWPANPDLAHEWHLFPAVQRWEWIEMVRDYDAKRDVASVYVEYGWDSGALDIEEQQGGDVPIWERLEKARERATQSFRGKEFETYRETWLEEMHERRQRERHESKAQFDSTAESNNHDQAPI